jgi:hypothetical protein
MERPSQTGIQDDLILRFYPAPVKNIITPTLDYILKSAHSEIILVRLLSQAQRL